MSAGNGQDNGRKSYWRLWINEISIDMAVNMVYFSDRLVPGEGQGADGFQAGDEGSYQARPLGNC